MKLKRSLWSLESNFQLSDFQWVDKSGKNPGEHILGKGSYAEVKLCKNKKNKLFACKIIPKDKVIKLKMQTYIQQEIDLHLKMKHPHILKLHGCAQDSNNVYLFLEYCKKNCLYFYIKKNKKLSENAAFTFFFQTALGRKTDFRKSIDTYTQIEKCFFERIIKYLIFRPIIYFLENIFYVKIF